MSFLAKVADRVDSHIQELSRDRHPYITREGSKWEIRKKVAGCRPVKAQTTISMDKDPTPLSDSRPKAAPVAPPPAKSATTTAPTEETEATSGKKTAEAAKENPPEAKKPEEDCPQPPPFDMLDLPEGMEAMDFKYAAYCARRWFNGKAHVISEQSDAIEAKDFVDKDSLKLSWVLGFGTVRERYEHLLATGLNTSTEANIYNDAAMKVLFTKFRRFMAQRNNYYSGTLDALAECANDKQMLHQQFQFQNAGVSMLDVTGGVQKTLGEGLAMNDLAASLANFGFYTAVATANVSTTQYNRYDKSPWQKCTHAKAEITHIYVYVKDTYSFNDKAEISQYLGHWNRQGVIIALDAAEAEQITKLVSAAPEFIKKTLSHERGNAPRRYLPPLPEHLDKPVDIKNGLRKTEVYYPVRNRDFHHWREIKQRGGDFLIFSNFERLKLPKPIMLDLGEICREYKQ